MRATQAPEKASRPASLGFHRPYVGNDVLGMIALQLKAVGQLASSKKEKECRLP